MAQMISQRGMDVYRRDFIDALARSMGEGFVSLANNFGELTDAIRDLAVASQRLAENLQYLVNTEHLPEEGAP